MTRKDFTLIALTLNYSFANDSAANREYFEALCNRFATNLEETNPRFDRDRFLKACGL